MTRAMFVCIGNVSPAYMIVSSWVRRFAILDVCSFFVMAPAGVGRGDVLQLSYMCGGFNKVENAVRCFHVFEWD